MVIETVIKDYTDVLVSRDDDLKRPLPCALRWVPRSLTADCAYEASHSSPHELSSTLVRRTRLLLSSK
jgi:hypothetical protein